MKRVVLVLLLGLVATPLPVFAQAATDAPKAAPSCNSCDARQAAKRKLREHRQTLLPEAAPANVKEKSPQKPAKPDD
jgi:hypothetical protein